MKLTKLMLAMASGFALTFVLVGMTFAAPSTATYPANRNLLGPMITSTVTITPVPTVTVTHTQPVASVIALYFHLPYTEVLALHNSGVGFGVIARAYLTARASNGVLTPTQVLDLLQSGMGWGEIKKQYGVQPGGNGLGAIMSGRAAPILTPGATSGGPGVSNGPAPSNFTPVCPGNSCSAPGHAKPGKGPKK